MVEPIQQPGAGPITADTPCVKCDYDLRGQPMSGQCPECGTPVVCSGQLVAVRNADPRWAKRVSLGLTLILWGVVVLLGWIALAGAFLLYSDNIPGGWWEGLPDAPGFAPTAMWFLWHGCGIYWIGAVFLLTSPEPRKRFAEHALNLRRVVRMAGFLLSPVAVIQLAILWRESIGSFAGRATMGRVSNLCAVALFVLLGVYVSTFAKRTSDPALGRSMLGITGGIVGTLSGLGVVSLCARGLDGNLEPFVLLLVPLQAALGLLAVALAVAYFRLLRVFRNLFRDAARGQ